MVNTLSFLQDYGFFSSLDIRFGRFAARYSEEHPKEVGLAAALVSRFTREGHVCIDLNEGAGKEMISGEEGGESLYWPHLEDWRRALMKSTFVGTPGDMKPLILDGSNRLYLHRYWSYQEALAAGIKGRISIQRDFDPNRAIAVLETLFPPRALKKTDWQKVAAYTALFSRFCVIIGGPGTGKTTTVARLLALILELELIGDDRIALLSPTGKGAIRLRDVLRVARERLPVSERVKESLPKSTFTIHRFLGGTSGSSAFRFHRKNRLAVDMAIIDEASMVDLPLMSNLVQALPDHAKLLLLGDRDQLASVEAGAVLGDICAGGPGGHFSGAFPGKQKEVLDKMFCTTSVEKHDVGLEDCIVHLQHNFRFEKSSGIGLLSRAIKDGEGREAADLLRQNRLNDVHYHPVPSSRDLSGVLRESIIEGFRGYLACQDPVESLLKFEGFRILCATREGPFGVWSMNSLVEESLERTGFIHRNRAWYPGRPVMITKNDYRLGLFNGDVGITGLYGVGDLRVFFLDQEGSHRLFHPYMLPDHETTFAATVHKSQGSEFNRILLLLPDRDSPILSRELLYTGITRAKEHVDIWGSVEVFEAAVNRKIHRRSGLRDLLWGT